MVGIGRSVSGWAMKLSSSHQFSALPPLLACHNTHFVILSNIDLGSSIKVGSVTLLRSAPGRNCDMIWDRTALIAVSWIAKRHCTSLRLTIPLIGLNYCLILAPCRIRSALIAGASACKQSHYVSNKDVELKLGASGERKVGLMSYRGKSACGCVPEASRAKVTPCLQLQRKKSIRRKSKFAPGKGAVTSLMIFPSRLFNCLEGYLAAR